MTDFGTIKRTDRRSVAFVEFNNPPVNLVDQAFMKDLEKLFSNLEADPTVKVIVFRSTLPDYFVNHFDLSPASVSKPTVEGQAPPTPLFRLLMRLPALPQATIGEIRGRVRGGGSEFCLALDMRFASRERAYFGQPEVGVGLHPGAGGTQRLPALMGRARALEVMLSGEDYDATVAEQYGWINRAIDDAELSDFVEKLAYRIAGFPAAGLANIKKFVNLAYLPSEETLAEESRAFRVALANPEFADRLAWLFRQGAQTAGPTELALGTALSGYPQSSTTLRPD
jgi:enoyl-CoA hydratase/carnithine racemase